MGKKRVEVKLDWSEIIYEVEDKTYLTARGMSDAERPESVANVQATADVEERVVVVRALQEAWARVRSELWEWVEEKETSASWQWEVGEHPELCLSLLFPGNYNEVATADVVASAHAYLVNMALAAWFGLTRKEEVVGYLALAESALAGLREAAHRRRRPVRGGRLTEKII